MLMGYAEPECSEVTGWRARAEDECSNCDRDEYVKDPDHVVRSVVGYFNGELCHYSLEPVELVSPEFVQARIWTEVNAVRHHTYGRDRTVVSDLIIDTVTSADDVARTFSDSLRTAMRY